MKIPKVRLEVWKTKSPKGQTLFSFIFEEPFHWKLSGGIQA